MSEQVTEKEIGNANDWESSRIHMIEESERKAWNVAKVEGVLLGLAIIAIVALAQITDVVPYVIKENETTGELELLTALDIKNIGYNEARDNHWLNKYIIARESYDWYMIQKDYDLVGLLSSRNVGQEYAALYTGEDALDKRYGSKVKVTVKVHSVVPGEGVGTIRFTKTVQRVDDPLSAVVNHWIATISYEYKPEAVMKTEDRLLNPYGFQVTSYRIDPEMEVSK